MNKYLALLALAVIAGLLITFNPLENEQARRNDVPAQEFTFDKESRNVYKLDYSSDIVLYINDSVKNDKYSLECVVNFRALKHLENEVIALMQLSNVSLKTSNEVLSEGLSELYSQMFVVRLAKSGELLNLYFKFHDDDYQGLMQLLGSMQIILEDKQAYDRTEYNYDGSVHAKYVRDKNDKFKIRKSRLEYLTYSNEAVEMKILNSDINVSLDENWIKELTSREKFEAYSDGKKAITNTNKMRLLKRSDLFDGSLEIWNFNGDVEKLMSAYGKTKKESYFEGLKQKIKKRYFSDNAITMKTLIKNLKAGSINSLIQLREYITLYPEEAKLLHDLIVTSKDDLSAALINVLEVSGTPEAQNVLRKIAISDEMNHMGHLRAVIALGGVENPTEDSINLLWRVYEDKDSGLNSKDLSTTSLLSVGAASRHSEQKEEINVRLKDEFNSNPDDAYHKKSVLLSMQNADANNFKPEIYDALKDDNEVVKASAVKALKGINSDEVKDKMLQLFNTNEDKLVRAKVIKTLKSIDANDELMAQAKENIFKEEDNLIRKDLILYLIQNADRYPQNVETLKKLKKVESDRGNKTLLIKYGI